MFWVESFPYISACYHTSSVAVHLRYETPQWTGMSTLHHMGEDLELQMIENICYSYIMINSCNKCCISSNYYLNWDFNSKYEEQQHFDSYL